MNSKFYLRDCGKISSLHKSIFCFSAHPHGSHRGEYVVISPLSQCGWIVAAAVVGALNVVLLFAYKPSHAGVLAAMCSCSEDQSENAE